MALAFRLWGLDFGLPMAEARPDEMTIAFQAMKFGRGDLNPHSFNYPSLFKYIVFGEFGLYFVIGKLTHQFASQEDFLRAFFDGAVDFRLMMRLWSALLGTLGVALLLRSPGGIWSAILLAVACLHVRDSHFGVTDITMVTFATGAVLLADRMRGSGRVRDAVLAGLVAGLATSTKYNAAVLAIPLASAALLAPSGRVKLLAVTGGSMVFAFLLGTPYALLDFNTFLHDFRFELDHLAAGHHVDVGNAWVHHFRASLRNGLGEPLLAAGIFGILLSFGWDLRQAIVYFSFPIVYFALIGRGETAFYRYILPVVPFLCIGAGMIGVRLRQAGWITALVYTVVLALPTAYASVNVVRLMAAGDTRNAMGHWIEANIDTDTTIVHAGAYTGAPMLQRNVANQTREFDAKQGRSDSAGFRKPDDMKWYSRARPMYDVLFVRKEGIDFASQVDADALAADPPPWILVEDYFLTHYSAVPSAVTALVAEKYELAHTEAATDGYVRGPVFDQQDAFYLPIANFRGFERMGPTLNLYRLREDR